MSAAFSILVPLGEGFEEIEAIVPVDVWRRAGFQVTTATLSTNPLTATRQTRHLADTTLDEVINRDFDLIYLPGGRPGADNLAANGKLLKKLQQQAAAQKWIAAICAAPLALNAAGLLAGKKFTCHPTAIDDLKDVTPLNQRIVIDGKLVTGIAAGAAFELALTMVRLIGGEEAVAKVNQGLLCPPSLSGL
ncbi:MAG: DJ-1/PfpI family protein [Verrucomicrobiales bacterium]|jgi:4-methyl-5(b-hydroxyethyl)-thiazole monophosphate biosynthesis|nr:DJ-1/PfpI family protein [Verrucomicrobiales bacterium]